VRHQNYNIELEGTSLKVCGDDRFLFSVDLLRCLPPSGCYQVFVEVAKRNDIHQGALSALGRAVDELLSPVFECEEPTGEYRLRLERWDADNVARRFNEEASLYINQPNQLTK
jgi:hypothetical protein